MIASDFLERQLAIIKDISDGNLTWQDLNSFRAENGIQEHLDSTRRNARFLRDYLEAGWIQKPIDTSGIATRILAVSDFHVPFQKPVEIFKDYVGLVDRLVLNGDIEDCQSISAFNKKYRIDVVKEMIETR